MVKEQLKPKKGVVVTEINGVKYFKLQSNYTGDYTKNCGLLGTEIDENFYFLRSNDIDKMSVKNGILTLTRVDGGTLSADISMPYTFNFDEKTGKLIITDGNGDVQVLEGFVVEGKDVRVATDATLNGDGTKGNPLRISELEKTGTYAPANEFLDMAVYTYFELVRELLDDGTEIYHYEERMKNQVPEGADVIEYSEKPTKDLNFESPRWIKVRKDINLPDASKLGAGYRIVTRESKDNFGLLYNYDGVKKIQAALDTTGSLWRIPTRRDWALMLNAAEYCEEDRDHDTKYVNEWTGKNAGARAKATTLWMLSNRQEKGLPVAGEDSLPIAGTNKFTVYPVGYADGSRGADDKDFDLEAFTKKSSFWSITPTDCNGEKYSSNIFTRTFAYDTRKVLQESSKPSSRMSIRLVKDFEPGQMNANEIENILGYDMPVVLLTNDETGYSKLWTSINVGFSEEQYDGVYSKEWSAATGSERGHEIVYYINVWDGKEWHKKQMNEGDSIVLLNGGKDESGNTIYNHEWRIYSGETEPMLIDTAKAIKGEFQKEIDELNEKVDDLSDITKELSTVTKETKENLENEINRAKSAETALRKDIDDLSAFTETAEDNVNDLVNDIIGVEGNVVSGFAMPNFYGAYWKDIDKSEYDTAPNDEKEHIHGSEIPSAAEWHEEHPSINYIELFDDSVEPHVYKYVKLETDAHYISDAENIIDAIEKLDGAISEAVGDIMVKKLDEPAPDMLASYVLLVGDEQKGDRINIPKDDVQAFHEVKVGHSGATINSETGEIIDGPYADHEVLIISYLNSEHVYKLVEIDLEDIIIENEFKDGFNVEGHEVKVKIDDASEKVIVKYDENENVTEKVLSVSPDGVKVSHIQDAINAAVEKEKIRATAAEISISGAVNTFSGATVNKFTEIDGKIDSSNTSLNELSAATKTAISNLQSELDTTQTGAGLKEDGSYKGHDSQSEGMTYITTATSIDNATVLLDKGIQKETNRATEEEKALRGLITDSTTKVSELSAATETFSGATVAEIAKVDGKINDEITRATAAEKSISGDVDTLKDSIKTFSGATVDEIARLDAQSKKNKVKSTGNTIVVTEATEGTNLDVNIDGKTILSNKGELKTGLKVVPLAAGELEANVREAFRLVDNEGTPVDGTTIKIYKSSSLVSVELISKDDIDYVRITYIDNSGATQTMDLNIQQLIFESEFKDGLVVNENGEVRVKIDPTSEVFLTVSSEGIKVSGLQNAINTAVAAEVARATAAEDSISANVTTLSSTTETFSASTVAKFEVMESGWNVPGSIKHTIEDAFVKSVAVGSSEDSNKSLMRYYNDGDEHKYYVSSSANDMYYNGLPLSTVIKNIKDEITQSSNDTDELSAATISEVARLDRRINDETTRATAAENSISGTVNTLSAATESEIERIEGKLSDNERVTSEAINQLKDEIDKTQEGAGLNEDGSYHKHNTVGDMANYITNATSLDNADMMLDSALKAESDRAIASEESISGIVNTFSATTESTIKNLQEQLTEANSIIETLRTEIQTLSGVVETIESQMAVNIYSTVRAMLQGASKQIKVTPDDDSKQINIGFADDAIFGQ